MIFGRRKNCSRGGCAQASIRAPVSGHDAIDLLDRARVVQRRLIDGLIAKATKRIDDTAAHTYGTDRSAAELCARVVGVGSGEAKRAIETAKKLQSLPATDEAVRAGKLSSRQADMIATAAADDPSVERSLLKAASQRWSGAARQVHRGAGLA